MLAWMKARGAILIAWAVSASAADLTITVQSGAEPIAGASVSLYRAGKGKGTAAVTLASGASDAAGKVRIAYPPQASTDLLYVLANGASSAAIRLAAVLGADAPSGVVVNELTTV